MDLCLHCGIVLKIVLPGVERSSTVHATGDDRDEESYISINRHLNIFIHHKW